MTKLIRNRWQEPIETSEIQAISEQMRAETAKFSMEVARRKEQWIRSELRRLHTHRLNVILEDRGSRCELDGDTWTVHFDLRLVRLLPPGPRPLP